MKMKMKMKVTAEAYNSLIIMLTASCLLLISGLGVHSLSYDYSATTECMAEPQRAHYGGGIIVNPGFDHSIEGWTAFGKGSIDERISKESNRFLVARHRTQVDGFSQEVQLKKGMLYSFSAWFQLSEGSETVSVMFKTNRSELIRVGHVIAKHGCWTMLKGGIVANFSSPAEILFESKNPKVEIWADSVSLQPFTKKQWRSHQDESIERVRKSKVRFQVTHINETALEGARVFFKQTKSGFPFGCGMNYHILTSNEYQKWFVSRFKYTTFTNAMKWKFTETKQGEENYTTPDAMLEFAKENGISVRGHNILWDDPKEQPEWVKSLSPEELGKAAAKRLNSVVSRYKGQLIAWDVVNENLHFRFFEDELGANASAEFFSAAYQLDPETTMFMNEFDTIENSETTVASPVNYRKKLEEILSFPGNSAIKAGIGLQGRFLLSQLNIAYMRSALDHLGAAGVPIWLTEVCVNSSPNQAQYLEEILREGYSHPAVQGIIMFAGPAVAGFSDTTLADENFQNTPAGDVVDKLINEWKTEPLEVIADSRGFVDVSLHHGDYDVTVTHPLTHSSQTLNLIVRKGLPRENIQVKTHT